MQCSCPGHLSSFSSKLYLSSQNHRMSEADRDFCVHLDQLLLKQVQAEQGTKDHVQMVFEYLQAPCWLCHLQSPPLSNLILHFSRPFLQFLFFLHSASVFTPSTISFLTLQPQFPYLTSLKQCCQDIQMSQRTLPNHLRSREKLWEECQRKTPRDPVGTLFCPFKVLRFICLEGAHQRKP